MIRKWRCLLALLLSTLLFCACAPAAPETLDVPPSSSQEPPPPPSSSEVIPEVPKIGWVEEDGNRYYYDEDGVMLTGWLGLEGNWYYLQDNGVMATGKTVIDGETCFFGPDGVQFLLVNPWNFMPEGYTPEVTLIDGWQYGSVVCKDDLLLMLEDCRKAGHIPYVASAFRTHEKQVYLYNNKIQRLINEGYSEEEARALAGTVVAVPGTSEHELGLAFDLVDSSYQNLDEAQENTPVQKWLMANSWKYGFILRYPNDKSEATGIIYEPWHYRYVGKTLAKAVYESGLCLEEYMDSISNTQ